jgi:hypothetical protein
MTKEDAAESIKPFIGRRELQNPMTLLRWSNWSSLTLPRYQQNAVETAIDQYKKDLHQVTENARDLVSCIDAVQDSATISQAVVGS